MKIVIEIELTVDNHPLRSLLVTLGYAWIASSYDRNDFDVASGVKSTHALIGRFHGTSLPFRLPSPRSIRDGFP